MVDRQPSGRCNPSPATDSDAAPDGLPSRKLVEFEQLAHGENKIIIVFNGQEYLLRATRSGRLILTK